MVKKKAGEPRREVTRRQLSRWQQQKRRQRIIFGSGIFIIVAILSIIGIGWYTTQYRPLHQTVIVVNDTEFNMDYYLKMLKHYGEGQPIQYMQPLADNMVEIIQRNELIRQGAMELGISVSDDEVDEKLKSYDPPLSKDYRDIVGAQMLLDKLRDEYFDKQVPMLAEQRHIMAMFLESESQATGVKARLEAGEDFAELAGELSLESFSKTEKGDLGWQPEGFLTRRLGTSALDDYTSSICLSCEVEVVSQPIHDEAKAKNVGYWLIKVVERDEVAQQALVQVILLGSEEETQEVRDRLEAGEDFATLAKEFSQHYESRENEGQLNISSPDMMSPAFSEFVFDSEIELETLSQPIRDDAVTTTGGYWLLKVVDIDDNRQIEDEDRDLLKADALSEWVSSLWDDPENKIESYLDDDKKAWAIAKAIGG